MVETVGTQLRRARIARDLTLEDAARETKIRAARLADLEADVYTNFPNLAYARGFLTSYGKYLTVNVRPYLDAFENTSTFGVDDYQYLSEKPVGVYRAPRRVWRQRAPRKRLMALGGTLGLLTMTLFGWFMYINYLRLGDLNQLADHQSSRTRPGSDLNPAAMLAKPIPSESSVPTAVLPASTAAGVPVPVATRERAPEATALPTEVAMMEKMASAPPVAVPEQSTAPATPAPVQAIPVATTVTEPEPARDHQLVENPTVIAPPPAAAAARHLSAHAQVQARPKRVSFDSTPPQPATAVKSFE